MQINLPKASVGLGTSGIGDNFARARLMMAQKAGYVQSTPSPYSQPGTALKQYQSAAPVLNAVANAQGQKGIPGLLRQGMAGRPPMAGVPGQNGSLVNTPQPMFQSTVAGKAVGNPFQQLGQPQMPLNWFNNPGQVNASKPNPAPPGSPPPVPPPNTGVGKPGDVAHPNLPNIGAFPKPQSPMPPAGGIVGEPPGDFNHWGGFGGIYPPGTISNFSNLLFPLFFRGR